MILSISTGWMLVGTTLLVLTLAYRNGSTEPVAAAITSLQHGDTVTRREAVELLTQIGDKRAWQPLAQALHDADALVREAAEHALWNLWHRSGNEAVDRRLRQGLVAMQRSALAQAVDIFSEVIAMAPDIAEGYNKRATTFYMMQDYEKAIVDCDKTLELNPVHFGALSGAGLCYLGLRDVRKALEYFERAVAVNPNMPQIRQYIEDIKKYLRDQTL